jgi:hypothetical protein
MAVDFRIKKGVTKRDIQVTLKYDGSAVDVSGATSVRFHMKAPGASSAKVDAAATLVDGANGVVKYEWQAADVDTVGVYKGEFEVTYSNGDVETFPSDHYIYVEIIDDLA